MTGLQSSFNSNRRWAEASLAEHSSYLVNSYILKTDEYPWIGIIPANQFCREQENQRELDDYLTPFFLVFFFIYAICRIML